MRRSISAAISRFDCAIGVHLTFSDGFPYGNPFIYKTIGEAILLDDFQEKFYFFARKKAGAKNCPGPDV